MALIAFTGSRSVGLHINREAAEPRPGQDHVKRVIAEMGGKNAIIIDDDADLDEAVHGVVASAFGYQGQKCSACSPGDRAGGAVRRLPGPAGRGDAQPQGRARPRTPAAPSARSSTPRPSERILRTIEKGKSEGRLAYAGDVGPLAQEGYLRRPAHLRRRAADGRHRPGRNLRPGAGGAAGRTTSTQALEIANGTRLRPDRRPLLAQPGDTSPGASASSASATCTSTARSPAPWWIGSRSAASRCRASARRRAGRIICCNSCCRALSRRIPCGAASRRHAGETLKRTTEPQSVQREAPRNQECPRRSHGLRNAVTSRSHGSSGLVVSCFPSQQNPLH